jgi:hypothetical protein
MSEETKQINLAQALSILDNVSKEFFITEAWVPSLKRTVKIKEITANQQKTIIESAIDSVVSKSTFSKIFYEIVSYNCLEEKSVIEAFTVADKASISFSMRKQISDTIKVVLREEPKIELEVSLEDIITKFCSYTHPENKLIKFEKNGVTIEVEIGLPLFSTESTFDSLIYGKEKSDNQVEEIKNLLTGAFLGEAAKYIKEIRVGDQSLQYSSLYNKQKILVVEKFPAALVQTIIENIISLKKELDTLSTVSVGEGKDEITKVIEVDNLLFLTN